MNHWRAVALALALALTACATVRGVYHSKIKGPWYMKQAQYKEGIADFDAVLREEPGNADAAYWVGRYWLALERPREAVPYLQRAARLDPESAENHFWLGVSYWGIGDWAAERAEYDKTLAIQPRHLSANLYLGHNYLDRGEWSAALAQYDRVLELDRGQAEALFDRAVALGKLKRKNEEHRAWLRFLETAPEGGMALEAADSLNAFGDFTYRNALIGKRRVTLRRIEFDSKGALTEQSRPSLDLIAAMMENNKGLRLHILVYCEGEPLRAKSRALAVRRYITTRHPEVEPSRLTPNWFGAAEKINAGGRTFKENNSVNFVTKVP